MSLKLLVDWRDAILSAFHLSPVYGSSLIPLFGRTHGPTHMRERSQVHTYIWARMHSQILFLSCLSSPPRCGPNFWAPYSTPTKLLECCPLRSR
jgi:hypothetical protein